MDFRNEYLFYFDNNYEKAELLWLWYDYHTEIFDQSLWSKIPHPYDETMVIHNSPEARKLSIKNAGKLRNYILEVSRKCKIPDEEMQRAKMSSYRNKSKMQHRINEYLRLDEQGKFQFINKILG